MDYNKVESKKFIHTVLSNSSLCPCLLIGRYVNEFKHIFKDTIERVYNLQEVKNVVEEYEGVSSVNSGFLVLDGVGYLSDVGQNSLLKFIEESKLPIVLLSYTDRVSPIIMSRMKIVVKLWYSVKSLSFTRVSDAQKALSEKKSSGQMKEYDEVQFLADNCPMLYSIKRQAGDPFDYSNQRMINLITGS